MPADEIAVRMPWGKFKRAWAETFKQGDHVTIIAPTGWGKTTLAVEIVEPRTYVLFLATKPQDPIITALKKHGWRVTHKLDIQHTSDGKVVDRRLVYWPVVSKKDRDLSTVRFEQATEIQKAFNYVYKAGEWCVLADETIWLADGLKLEPEIETILFQGRTLGVSLISLAQRPAEVPRACYSQANHVFLSKTSDKYDMRRLSDIGGGQSSEIQQILPTLQKYDFLYYNKDNDVLMIVRVDRPKK